MLSAAVGKEPRCLRFEHVAVLKHSLEARLVRRAHEAELLLSCKCKYLGCHECLAPSLLELLCHSLVLTHLGRIRCRALRIEAPRDLGRLRRRALRTEVPRVAQRRLFQREEGAQNVLLTIHSDRGPELAMTLCHAFEARPGAQ